MRCLVNDLSFSIQKSWFWVLPFLNFSSYNDLKYPWKSKWLTEYLINRKLIKYFMTFANVYCNFEKLKKTEFLIIFCQQLARFCFHSVATLCVSVWNPLHLLLNWTNTPLFMKQTWMTEQPTSTFPVWKDRVSSVSPCKVPASPHSNPNSTLPLSPSATLPSQNSTEPLQYLVGLCHFANLYSMRLVLSEVPRRAGLPEKWKVESL